MPTVTKGNSNRRGRGAALLLALPLLLVAFIVWRSRDGSGPAPVPTLEPPRPTTAATPRPTATPTPTPVPATPTPEAEGSRVVLGWEAEATPTPEATPEPVPEPRQAGSCVAVRGDAYNAPGTFGQIVVEVTLTSRCDRDLEPLEVWFRVSGYRGGDLLQTADGHPFDALDRGREVRATVAMPGDMSLYDRIEVEVTAPLEPVAAPR